MSKHVCRRKFFVVETQDNNSRGYEMFFMLNSTKHEISIVHLR